jgi:hypothetical protein
MAHACHCDQAPCTSDRGNPLVGPVAEPVVPENLLISFDLVRPKISSHLVADQLEHPDAGLGDAGRLHDPMKDLTNL